MRTYILALGADIWDVVDTSDVKPVVLANMDDKIEFSFDGKAMNVILSELVEAEFVKVMHLGTAKEMWDKLISSYEGYEKVKGAKLQNDQNLDQGAKFAQFSKCSECDENGAIASISSS
jgi:hypothetical protein